MRIIGTYSPCCKIFREGDAEQGIMHSALPHEQRVVKLVDEQDLARAERRCAELEEVLEECAHLLSFQVAGSSGHESSLRAREVLGRRYGGEEKIPRKEQADVEALSVTLLGVQLRPRSEK